MKPSLARLVAAGALALAAWGGSAALAHAEEPTTPPGMSAEQFAQQGVLAQHAQEITAALADDPGFGWVVVREQKLVVIGRGGTVQKVAAEHGATVDPSSFNATARNAHELRGRVEAEVGTEHVKFVGEGVNGLVIGSADPDAKPRSLARGQAKKSARELAAELAGVTVQKVDGDAKASATVYGGQSQAIGGLTCSLGFPMWLQNGAPGYLTAGHCSTARNGIPSYVGGAYFGTMINAVWGAPGSAYGSVGTDLGLLGDLSASAATPPEVLRHAAGGPVTITGRAASVPGLGVCKSGQTTGWTCGSISFNALIWVAMSTYSDGRWVWTAASGDVVQSYGDSGGAWVAGNKALGISSNVYDSLSAPTPFYRSGSAMVNEIDSYFPGTQLKFNVPPARTTLGADGRAHWGTSEAVGGWLQPLPGDSVEPGTRVRVYVDGVLADDVAVRSDNTFWWRYTTAAGVGHTISYEPYHGRNVGARTTFEAAPPPPTIFTQLQVTHSGVSQVGRTLVADPGTWIPTPTQLTYQWWRYTSAGYVAIPGATEQSYTLTQADLGSEVLVEATGVAPGVKARSARSGATPVGNATWGLYRAIAPQRLLDTRDAAVAPLAPGGRITPQVAGVGPVPAGATAVVLNLTSTGVRAPGHVVAWASQATRPTASNLNVLPGRDVAASVAVPVGPDGRINIASVNTAAIDLIVDVQGYYAPAAGEAGSLGIIDAARILDTRGGSACKAGETRELTVAGKGGVPSNAAAVIVRVTSSGATDAGHIEARAGNAARNDTSVVNVAPGEDRSNSATVPLSPTGSIAVTCANATTHLILDVQGWYAAGTPTAQGAFRAATPSRVLETRPAAGGTGPLAGRGTRTVTLAPPVAVMAMVGNLTAVNGPSAGAGALYPAGATTTASNVNAAPSQIIANQAHVQVLASKQVTVFNGAPLPADFLLDLQGWFLA